MCMYAPDYVPGVRVCGVRARAKCLYSLQLQRLTLSGVTHSVSDLCALSALQFLLSRHEDSTQLGGRGPIRSGAKPASRMSLVLCRPFSELGPDSAKSPTSFCWLGEPLKTKKIRRDPGQQKQKSQHVFGSFVAAFVCFFVPIDLLLTNISLAFLIENWR